MNAKSITPFLSKSFILLSAAGLLMVSAMAFINPQSVMDLVQVSLSSTDAYSSIRGVYGGVGLTIVLSLLYLLKHNIPLALGFLILLWGLYAVSRIITILVEGSLGAFGMQWLMIEGVFCLIAIILFLLNKKKVGV